MLPNRSVTRNPRDLKPKISMLSTVYLFCQLLLLIELCDGLNLPYVDTSTCPTGYEDHPLILISADGFRADYINKGVTPTIELLARRGVSAPYVKPSYPSITFPNHYTIATGLLPSYHGILSNKFFDPDLNSTFRVGRKEFFQRRFWFGEPIWKTVERQGGIAATYFWPGSETKGNRPTYWLPYNESHSFEHRVNVVMEWLLLPKEKRPRFMTLYMHQPDRQGHNFGPDSPQVVAALKDVDNILRYLLQRLVTAKLSSCVNVIMMSDHGMAAAGHSRLINVTDYIPDLNQTARYWNGVFPRFEPLDGSVETTSKYIHDLSCRRPEFRVYRKSQLPVRWHLGGSRRVEDIVLDLDAGYQVDFDGKYFFKVDEGDHGYDNYFHVMNALFLAHGPAFKRGVEVEAFQNIEVYNLMCHLTGVKPAPNNGTIGSLNHMLLNPPHTDEYVKASMPKIASLPLSASDYKERNENGLCSVYDIRDDLSEEVDDSEEQFQYNRYDLLWKAQRNGSTLLKKHLPYGVPQLTNNRLKVKLLLQPDHITAYSEQLRMPLWTSFHLESPAGSRSHSYTWIDDIRLSTKSLNKACSALNNDMMWRPLFHPMFSDKASHEELPYLLSNAVPMSTQLNGRWKELRELLLMRWALDYTSVNVVMGTVFDYNSDTLVDANLGSSNSVNGSIHVPTHLFMVVTRCPKRLGVGRCHNDWLDSVAYIFPQNLEASNCMDCEAFAREFSAKVDDVEKITGIKFFSQLNFEQRTKLKVRMHSNLWGSEKWENRIRSDLFGLKKEYFHLYFLIFCISIACIGHLLIKFFWK